MPWPPTAPLTTVFALLGRGSQGLQPVLYAFRGAAPETFLSSDSSPGTMPGVQGTARE